MTQRITIFGHGATGRPIAERLTARGDRVRIATRNRSANLPAAVEHMVCDVLDPADVRRALSGSAQAVLAVGLRYDSRLWGTVWPQAMTNMVEACADAGARLVFIDNPYQLGPQTTPRSAFGAVAMAPRMRRSMKSHPIRGKRKTPPLT